MKILTLTTSYPYSLESYNGIFIEKTVQALRDRGHDVSVIRPLSLSRILANWIISRAVQRIHTDDSSVALPIYPGLPLRVTGLRSWAVRWNEGKQLSAIKRAALGSGKVQNNTLIYAHFYSSIRIALKAYPGIPVVGVLGESDPWDYEKIYGSSWTQILLSCAAVVAVSRAGYDYYLDRCPELRDRLYCVPNGVDLNKFKPQDKSSCRTQLGINNEKKLAVFVGSFEERKGPMRVLDAARKAGFCVAFLGKGPQIPQGPEVVAAKSVEQDELLLWLGAADCFVLPSLSEGRSNAILEALSSGVPVVISDLPFNTEFVTPGCGALVNGTSSESIANGLTKVCDEKNVRSMRQEARRVAEGLSYEDRVLRLEAIFQKAANGLVQNTLRFK